MAGENTSLIEDSPLLSMDPQVREFVNTCPVPITPDSGSGPGPVTVPGHGPSPGPSGLPTLPTPTTATGSAAASNRILSRNANGTTKVYIKALLAKVYIKALLAKAYIKALLAKAQIKALLAEAQIKVLLGEAQIKILLAKAQIKALLAKAQIKALLAKAQIKALLAKAQIKALLAKAQNKGVQKCLKRREGNRKVRWHFPFYPAFYATSLLLHAILSVVRARVSERLPLFRCSSTPIFFRYPLALFFSFPAASLSVLLLHKPLGLPAASLGKADDMLQLPVLYVELLGKQ
ncbi:hypothetical protein CDAR_118541 [Caerostris darwini]|uniref:Uncharacterized protein n=1 Tax=Caerostris darwini TaxID=1538125 RepID=A0AAV4X1H1_9ARAC|nr:hypothetical protein CDAR_118541 [Caerostris darwini]